RRRRTGHRRDPRGRRAASHDRATLGALPLHRRKRLGRTRRRIPHREPHRGRYLRVHAHSTHPRGDEPRARRTGPQVEPRSGSPRPLRRTLPRSDEWIGTRARSDAPPSRLPELTERPTTMVLDIEPELLARVQRAIDDIRDGKMVILVDDEDREN